MEERLASRNERVETSLFELEAELGEVGILWEKDCLDWLGRLRGLTYELAWYKRVKLLLDQRNPKQEHMIVSPGFEDEFNATRNPELVLPLPTGEMDEFGTDVLEELDRLKGLVRDQMKKY